METKRTDQEAQTSLRRSLNSSRKCAKACGSNPNTCITSCISVADNRVSASAVRCLGATFMCPKIKQTIAFSSRHLIVTARFKTMCRKESLIKHSLIKQTCFSRPESHKILPIHMLFPCLMQVNWIEI